MPLVEAPEWVDRVLLDIAVALSAGAVVAWSVLVLPDPGPLVRLPTLYGVPPIIWLTLGLSVLWYSFVRRVRAA